MSKKVHEPPGIRKLLAKKRSHEPKLRKENGKIQFTFKVEEAMG